MASRARIAGLSRVALALLKRALKLGYGNWTRAMNEMERPYIEELTNTADAQEGLAAFMEKRTPVWKHAYGDLLCA